MDKTTRPLNTHDAINRAANDLIKRMVLHETQAMGLFFDATLAFVYGHSISVIHDPEQAEAVVADTYLYAWKHASHYNITWGAPLEWLLEITDAQARDRMRALRGAAASITDPSQTSFAPKTKTVEPRG
jgi:DNA-directed RNA polymerase specialized sigma24 family protein